MSATFIAPGTLEEALGMLRDAHAGEEHAPTVLAGGTDLWPQWTAAGQRPARVLSLHRIEELRVIEHDSDRSDGLLRVGATCTHGEIARSELVRRACPALAEAAATVGAVQIQNRGTIGGNLVNASPAADLPPPLAAAVAQVELASSDSGVRRVPIDRFFTGYRQIDRQPDELLTAILVPALPENAREQFRKVGTRRAQAISKVMGACRLELDPETCAITRAGIAFGSVAPTVVRLHGLERWLQGRARDEQTASEAGARAASAVQPIDDLRSSADYRRHVVGRMVRRWIAEL
jgi:CO/xanthine dehydrogenase FAD-binding subunit